MHAYNFGIAAKCAQDPLRIPGAMIDVHQHLPADAQKNNGLNAGVAMVRNLIFLSVFGAKMTVAGLVYCAIVSLLTEKCVPPNCLLP